MVARTAVPIHHVYPGVGAELHQAERRCGARISMAMPTSTDERVDVPKVILGDPRPRVGLDHQGAGQKGEKQEKAEAVHG